MQGLGPRNRDILRQAVGTFIASCEPVSSRALSKLNRDGLSSATIRNVLSELEEMGYLFQPHTSAGRVPTDKGYRFYVSTLRSHRTLNAVDQERIGSCLREGEDGVEGLVQRSLHLLADMTDTVSFVTGPDFEQNVLRHVDFVKLAPRRVLVVLVSETGQVINRVIELAEDLEAEELPKCARYLEREFQGHTLVEARESLVERLKEMRAVYDRLVQRSLTLGQVAFAGEMSRPEVYLEGTSRLLKMPEFRADIERAEQLLRTLEEKVRLVEILNACLDGDGLQIVIGSESRVPGFEGISLIGARYCDGGRELGSVGVVGPTRMQYARFISLVDYMARSLSEVISSAGSSRAH